LGGLNEIGKWRKRVANPGEEKTPVMVGDYADASDWKSKPRIRANVWPSGLISTVRAHSSCRQWKSERRGVTSSWARFRMATHD